MQADHTDAPAGCDYATVHFVFELSKSKWQLGVMTPGAEKMSRYRIDGGNLAELSHVLAKARAKAEQLGKPVRVLSCYEAGLDGHWLHRWLTDNGIVSFEVDASSIEVNRRARRAKTDRIDLALLMRAFLAYLRGEPGVCSMVRVPTPEDEDRKRRTRERERLLTERTGHTNRIKGLLHGQGIRDAQPLMPNFLSNLDQMRTGDGRAVPPRLRDEIRREHERLLLAHKQIKTIEAENSAAYREPAKGSVEAKAALLVKLKAVGPANLPGSHQRGVLSRLPEPASGRQLLRTDRHAVRQWGQPATAGHQQSRQPPGAKGRHRVRLAVAEVST